MKKTNKIQKTLYFLCLASILLFFGCQDSSDDDSSPAADTTAPAPGNSGLISSNNIMPSSLTLNWTKATDAVTPETSLEYLVYQSTTGNIDTVTNTLANGTAIDEFTADVATKSISGLTQNTSYYFNILVQDDAENQSVYTMICGRLLFGGFVRCCEELSLNTSTSTIAGTAGISGASDGTGTSALFNNPAGITSDGTNIYVTDNANHTVRKIVIATGEVTTLAGTAGVSGSADGTGTNARFLNPSHIITDGTNLYLTDWNHTIRKIVIATGEVTTLAGTAGITGTTDGIGSAARFNVPNGITTDGTNLYITEEDNDTVRKIVISSAEVTTFAGGTRGSADGTGTAAQFKRPEGITTDGTDLYVADKDNNTIRKIVISNKVVTTLAGSAGLTGTTDGTGSDARFNWPVAITLDGTNLFVTDFNNHTIRKIVISTGEVTTLAGISGTSGSTDGTGTSASFNNPAVVTTDGLSLYVTDLSNHTIRKIE